MNTDTGGSLGALFDYQNQVLTPLTGTINSMAEQFADAVNTQLAQGYDLNGNPGEPLFIYDENSSDGPLEVNPISPPTSWRFPVRRTKAVTAITCRR
jgi:flagellar hook-associated protein 1 FlgK